MPFTAQDLEARAGELLEALAAHGVTPETALAEGRGRNHPGLAALARAGIDPNLTLDEVMTPAMREELQLAEGRARARRRYQPALERAERHGYEGLRRRLEGMIEAEGQGHARRQMARLGIEAAAGEQPRRRAVKAAGRGIDYAATPGSPSPMTVLGSMPRGELTAPGQPIPPPPTMPPLAGPANDPNQPQRSAVRDVVRAAGRGIDYTTPASGLPPPLSVLQRRADVFGGLRQEDLGTPEEAAQELAELRAPSGVGVHLMPQDAAEREALREARQSGEALVTRVAPQVALTFGAGPAMQGVASAGRALAASPAGQFVAQRVVSPLADFAARTLARPTVQATAAPATVAGATVAGTSQAEPPDPVQTARENIGRLRRQQGELETEQTRLREAGRRFDSVRPGDTAAVRQAQEELSAMGLYGLTPDGKRVRPDGNWGSGTQDAINRYRQRTEGELANISKQLEGLGKDLERQEGEVRRIEGGARLREVGQPNFLEQYAPWLGYPIGYLVGSRGRQVLGRYMDDIAQARADRANALLTPPGRMSTDRRFGRANQFWTEGGSAQPPFTHVPGRRPHPWEANPAAAPAERLYRRSLPMEVGPGATVLGAGAAEMGAGWWLDAHDRLTAAQQAVRDRPNDEAAIQELVAARQAVARAEFLTALGRGTAIGGVVGEAKSRLTGRGIRPDMNRAEGERAALDRLLTRRNTPTGGSPPGGALWNEGLQRWTLDGRIVGGGNRWRPPQ